MEVCKICWANCICIGSVDKFKACSNESPFPLGKSGVNVKYWLCQGCGFIFTTDMDRFLSSDWQRDIYNDIYYSDVDKEYKAIRPDRQAAELAFILKPYAHVIKGLDFGGGNGKTAFNMRATGFDYISYDPHSSDKNVRIDPSVINFISAFEVFEHHPQPLELMRELIQCSNDERLVILICTSRLPNILRHTPLQWAYIAPRNGHISIASKNSMKIIAKRFSMKVFIIGNMHIFFKKNAWVIGAFIMLRIIYQKISKNIEFICNGILRKLACR